MIYFDIQPYPEIGLHKKAIFRGLIFDIDFTKYGES